MPPRKINPRQRKFVAEVLSGKTQTEAYMTTYPNATYDTAKNAASVLINKPHVQEHICAVIAREYPNAAKDAAQVLFDCIYDSTASYGDKMKAINMLTKLHGWNAATKVHSLQAKVDVSKFKLPGDE